MLCRHLAFVVAALAFPAPSAVDAQSAHALFDKMLEFDSKRAKGVSDYAMDITMMNHETTLYYERVSIPRKGERPLEMFRLVTFDEMKKRQEAGQGMPPDAWQAYSDGLRETGSAIDSEMGKGMSEAGVPAGIFGGKGSGPSDPEAEPWASPNPSTMMNSMADFAEAGSGGAPTNSTKRSDEAAMAQSMSLFRRRAKVVGKESIGKRRAIHARAQKLNISEKVNGEEITIDTISLWIDAEKYVPLKMRMNGVATQEGKSREIFIERFDQDYRTVPGSKLYLPHHNVMRVGGVLGPKEQKEMEEGRKKLDDLDRQLASMPPDQRASVEKMMGPQLEMIRKMVDGGVMEVETTVRAVRINTGLPGAFVPAASPKPMASAGQSESADALVQMIQRDLAALGYDPGNTDGELSTATVIAISKFQAENELAVTGEATPQLAGILAAKRDAAQPSAASNSKAEPLEEAQAACLQEKIDGAKKKKRAFGKAMKAVGNTASRYGGTKVSTEVERASREAYEADATAKDVEEAANALGLSKADIEACREPK